MNYTIVIEQRTLCDGAIIPGCSKAYPEPQMMDAVEFNIEINESSFTVKAVYVVYDMVPIGYNVGVIHDSIDKLPHLMTYEMMLTFSSVVIERLKKEIEKRTIDLNGLLLAATKLVRETDDNNS